MPLTETILPESAVLSAHAETSGTCGENLTWTLNDEGTLTISGTGEMTGSAWYSSRKSIKKAVISNGVTNIGESVFSDCTNLTSVTIPNSVTSIGNSAFASCTALASVSIPNSVTSIGNKSFSSCTKLTSLTIPSSVTSIGYEAFQYCTGLTSITIPSGVTSIGSGVCCGCSKLTAIEVSASNNNFVSENGVLFNKDKTQLIQYPVGNTRTSYTIPSTVTTIGNKSFYKCQNLTSVTIPDGVAAIYNKSFLGCTNLTSVTIPSTVTNIGSEVFESCQKLTAITVSANNADYASENGVLFNKNKTELIQYPAGNTRTSYTVPSTVTAIKDEAFYDCNNLTAVTLPYGVTSIGDYAFEYCSNLSSLTIPSSVTNIGYNAFQGTPWLTQKKKENPLVIINHILIDGTACSGSVTIPSDVTSIAKYAFYGCTALTSVTILSSVKSIGVGAFSGCSSLSSVAIPDTIESIGQYAFANTPLMKSEKNKENSMVILGHILIDGTACIGDAVIPNGVTCIADNAFSNCQTITSVTIPNSVKNIGTYAFSSCEKLESIKLPNSITTIGDSTFLNCKSLTSVNIPDSVEYIGNYTFKSCEKLESVEFPNSITTIGNSTFEQCKSLTSITIPDSVKSIGNTTFGWCEKLESIKLPNGITTIGNSTFSCCKSLTSVTIPDSVEDIGDNTFSFCEKLSSVKLPNGITTIGMGIFSGCKSLTSITIPDSVKTIEPFAFYAIDMKPLTLDENITEIGNCAFGGLDTSITIKNPTCKIGNHIDTFGRKLTIYGYKNSTAQAYAEKYDRKFVALNEETTPEGSHTFTWSRDNWNFNNSSLQGYFPQTTYRKQIDTAYLNKLKNALTADEYQFVFEGYYTAGRYYKALLDMDWEGSCYGMSSTALLSKEGLLPYADYQAGASSLYALNAPVKDRNVNSLITYYQMLQVKYAIQQQYRTVPLRSHEANIKAILSELDQHDTVLIGFKKSDWSAHAILAYDYSYGSWTWNGVNYDSCISICDPNHSISYDKSCNIYFNSKTYNWTIPYYQNHNISSAYGAVFNYIGGNTDEINKGGYLSGNSVSNSESYIARIDAPAVAENHSVTKVKKDADNEYIMQTSAAGDIVADTVYMMNGSSDGTYGYNLRDSESGYKISQNEAQNMELLIKYENCTLSGSSAAGSDIIFDKDGYVSVSGENADFGISMVFNENYPTDWFALSVTGEGANHADMTMQKDGYVLTADSLNHIVVRANNKQVKTNVTFSTDYSEVFIYEIDENTIGIAVDTDNNGSYETTIAKSGDVLKGDADGSGEIDILDVITVNKAIMGKESITDEQLKAIDFNENGKPDSGESLTLLKYIVGLIESLA